MRSGKLFAGAALAVLLAGCVANNDPGAFTRSQALPLSQQTTLAQTDVSRYVAAMSEQPGQLKLKDRCGHERSWNRIQGLSTGNEGW
jgi:hypothetical protein